MPYGAAAVDGPGADLVGDAAGLYRVGAHDGRGEAKLRVVDERDRLGLGGEGTHCQTRAEHLRQTSNKSQRNQLQRPKRGTNQHDVVDTIAQNR